MENATKVRALRPEDLQFIYSTWLRGLYYGNSYYKRIKKDVYFSKYKLVLRTLLEQRPLAVKVMCLNTDEDTILGYSVSEGDTLHWVYVKEAWRKMGVGKRLVGDNITAYSHFTNMVKNLLPKTWEFNPFL